MTELIYIYLLLQADKNLLFRRRSMANIKLCVKRTNYTVYGWDITLMPVDEK